MEADTWPLFVGQNSMYGLLEIGIVMLILAAIFVHPAAREWVSHVNWADRRVVMAFFAMLMIGQVVNQSRTTFPFVRWSMYTDILEDKPISVAKFQAIHADGTKSWINPTLYYPSICRNSFDRNALIIQRQVEGKLSRQADELFGEFMMALGRRYQAHFPHKSVVEVHAVLQTVVVEENKCFTEDVVGKSIQLLPGKSRIARVD